MYYVISRLQSNQEDNLI